MTERRTDNARRLDLRSLDPLPDSKRVDDLVAAVIDRVKNDISKRVQHSRELVVLRRARRYLLAAAVVFALFAIASVVWSSRRMRDVGAGAELVAQWTQAGHIPTNGELLVVYKGYRP
jgi:hypothetical protein